jgi:hypothetical protein
VSVHACVALRKLPRAVGQHFAVIQKFSWDVGQPIVLGFLAARDFGQGFVSSFLLPDGHRQLIRFTGFYTGNHWQGFRYQFCIPGSDILAIFGQIKI